MINCYSYCSLLVVFMCSGFFCIFYKKIANTHWFGWRHWYKKDNAYSNHELLKLSHTPQPLHVSITDISRPVWNTEQMKVDSPSAQARAKFAHCLCWGELFFPPFTWYVHFQLHFLSFGERLYFNRFPNLSFGPGSCWNSDSMVPTPYIYVCLRRPITQTITLC